MSGPAANGNTFDLVPPRRPSVVDCGDVVMVDDLKNPPVPGQMPTAAQFNALAGLTAAYGAVLPHTTISIHIAAGVPGLFQTASTVSAVQATPGSFLTVNDLGAGDTSITWPANTFPPSVARPTAGLNDDGGVCASIYAKSITNGVEVKTRNAAGTLVDLDFTVEIR